MASIFDSMSAGPGVAAAPALGATAPTASTPPIPSSVSIDSLMQQATQMANQGGPGKNQATATKWLQSQIAKMGGQPKPTSIFANLPEYPKDTPPGKAAPIAKAVPAAPAKGKDFGESILQGMADTANLITSGTVKAGMQAAAYGAQRLQDYNKVASAANPSRAYTKEELSAAKEIGIHVPGTGEHTAAESEMWGLPKQSPMTGPLRSGPFNAAAYAKAHPKYDTTKSPLYNFLTGNTPITNVANTLNAPTLNRLRMGAIDSFVSAKNIIKNPTQYTPQEVKTARLIVSSLKDHGVLAGMKQVYQQAKQSPQKFAMGIVEGLIQDPEFALVGGDSGEVASGMLGKIATGAGEGAVMNAAIAPTQATAQQGYSTKGDMENAAAQGLAFGTIAAGVHGLAGKVGSIFDSVPSAGEVKAPDTGATAKATAKDAIANNTPANPAADAQATAPTHVWRVDDTKDVGLAGGVSKDGKTVYLSKEIPDSIEVPGKDGQKVNINPKRYITEHELLESSLMRLKAPMSPADVVDLQTKVGADIPQGIKAKLYRGEQLSYQEAHHLATLAENKLFAQENPNVDHETYQQSLGKYIKAAKESALQNKGNTPADLDEKPYRDSGEQKLVDIGKGKEPTPIDAKQRMSKMRQVHTIARRIGLSEEDRKAAMQEVFGVNSTKDLTPEQLDNHLQALKDLEIATKKVPSGMKSKVANKLLAAGALTGTGALIGASLGEPGQRKKGAASGAMLIGPLSLGGEFDRESAGKAWDMLNRGVDTEKVRQETGITQIAGGHLAKEISTKDMVASPPSTGISHSLSDILKGPAADRLFKAYPHLANVKVEADSRIPGIARALRDSDTILINPTKIEGSVDLKNILLHEIQHLIQKAENWPHGANLDKDGSVIDYLRSAGEVYARLAQERGELSQDEMDILPPEPNIGGKPIAHKDMILSYKSRGPSAMEHIVPEEDKLPDEMNTVEDARQGSQEAIATLYKKYMPMLIRRMRPFMQGISTKMGLSEEDIASMGFQKAIQNLDSFNGHSSFYTWLYAITKNVALDTLRGAERTPKTTSIFAEAMGHDPYGSPTTNLKPSVEAKAADTSTPEEILQSHQTAMVLQRALSKLPEGTREAIQLKDMEGLSEQEIADKQGVPLGTVKSRLSNGRAALKAEIDKSGRTPLRQRGMVTGDQLKRLALLSAGAAAGAALGGQQHAVRDGIYGSLIGLFAGGITLAGIRSTIADIKSTDTTPRISPILDDLSGDIRVSARHINDLTDKLKLVQGDNSLDIAHSIEGDTSVKLTPAQEDVKEIAQNLYKKIMSDARAAGLSLKEVLAYVTHIFKMTEKNKTILDTYAKQSASPLSAHSKFQLKRVGPPTLREALDLGLELKHDNFADTLREYLNSMQSAIHTKVALDAIKKVNDMNGRPLLRKAAGSPRDYVTSNHPALRGYAMHPSIAVEMSHLFDVHTPTHIGKMIAQVNSVLKRLWFSWNFFHLQALTDAQTGMSLNPIKNAPLEVRALLGKTPFHDAINNPTPGDIVDKALKYGVMLSVKGKGGSEDVGDNSDVVFDPITAELNKVIPGLGKLSQSAKVIDRGFSKILWDNTHAGLKGMTFSAVHDTMEYNWIKAVEKDPTVKMPPDGEIWKEAANFANVSFGNLDWRSLANSVKNKYLHPILMSAFSPDGRRSMQMLMVAPDWLVSTSAHWLRAFQLGAGHNLEGIIHPRNAVDLHRAWLARSTFAYLLYANALNMAMSNHPIWDNKDKTMIDLGDGRKMSYMKEYVDFPRYVMHPAQETLNKLSPVVKNSGQQIMGTQYLSASGFAPRMSGFSQRMGNLVNSASPISTNMETTGGWPSVASNIIGRPIYGHDPAIWAKHEAQVKKEAKVKAAKTRQEHLLKLLQGDSNG